MAKSMDGFLNSEFYKSERNLKGMSCDIVKH